MPVELSFRTVLYKKSSPDANVVGRSFSGVQFFHEDRSIDMCPIVAFRSAKERCFRGAKGDYYCSNDPYRQGFPSIVAQRSSTMIRSGRGPA